MTYHVSTYIHNGNYLGILGYFKVLLDCFVIVTYLIFHLVFFEYL